MPLRTLMIAALMATLNVGCSRAPTSPARAFVQFDSLTVVMESGARWHAVAMHNRGNATAYQVTAYWHLTNSDSAQSSPSQPFDLSPGEKGLALMMLTDHPAWYGPAEDSIRWH